MAGSLDSLQEDLLNSFERDGSKPTCTFVPSLDESG